MPLGFTRLFLWQPVELKIFWWNLFSGLYLLFTFIVCNQQKIYWPFPKFDFSLLTTLKFLDLEYPWLFSNCWLPWNTFPSSRFTIRLQNIPSCKIQFSLAPIPAFTYSLEAHSTISCCLKCSQHHFIIQWNDTKVRQLNGQVRDKYIF